MNLSLILLSAYNSWNSPRINYYDPPDTITTIFYILIIIVPFFVIIFASILDWNEISADFKNYFFKFLGKTELISSNIPLGLKYILLNMGIKSRNIKHIYKINRKNLKKMDTYFSYEIVTFKEKFHIYFDDIDGNKSWFIYKKGQFKNKPIRIKNNYYDIIEIINNDLYNNIKNNFHNRLKEQSFAKS